MVDYDESTNYKFKLPKSTAKMSNVNPTPHALTYLDDNFTLIEGIPAANSVTGALPQSGSYNRGDRVYRTDDTSIYILVIKDTAWGWHWKPIHAAISPWVAVPSAAITLSPWITLSGDRAWKIAFDNRGRCYWRGGVKVSSGTISSNVSHQPFAALPVGLYPRNSIRTRLGVDVFNPSSNSGIAALQGARLFIGDKDSTVCSIRVFQNSSNTIHTVYFDGCVEYAPGEIVRWTAP